MSINLRFVNDTTVLLSFIPFAEQNKSPVDSINDPMLETNAQILQTASPRDRVVIQWLSTQRVVEAR